MLTDRQATSLSKAFANKSSANTKFLKTKLSEIIHSAGFLGRLFGPLLKVAIPASNYMFKVNNRHTRASCEICSELKIKTPEWHHWHRSGDFIVNFEHISHLVLVFLLLILSR